MFRFRYRCRYVPHLGLREAAWCLERSSDMSAAVAGLPWPAAGPRLRAVLSPLCRYQRRYIYTIYTIYTWCSIRMFCSCSWKACCCCSSAFCRETASRPPELSLYDMRQCYLPGAVVTKCHPTWSPCPGSVRGESPGPGSSWPPDSPVGFATTPASGRRASEHNAG